MKKTFGFTVFFLIAAIMSLVALDLTIAPEDVIIMQGGESGYDLWIRKKPDIKSVLLTESTKDPQLKEANYSLRNPSYHPVNGDEKRMLEGEFLDPAQKLYSLIDSTPEPHPKYGSAYHIFIPYIVVYGYAWSRHGELEIRDDTFINIRTYQKPYGDYTGAFRDNPFKLVFIQRPLDPSPTAIHLKETAETFTKIAREGGGESHPSLGKNDIVAQIDAIVKPKTTESLDLVLCLDTTASMENDLVFVKQGMIEIMKNYGGRYKTMRIGIVFYKDYLEQYVNRIFPFAEKSDIVEAVIQGAVAQGGRDTPEAVYEALYAAIHQFKWASESKLVILIGDAPPHPTPRGRVTKEMVFTDAKEAGIEISTIILPQ